MNNDEMNDSKINKQLDSITSSSSLREVDNLLTRSMAEKEIQKLIKNNNLSIIVNSIVDLGLNSDKNSLFAAAMLGRLGAVSRSRESEVYTRINELFNEEPLSIEVLRDGDEKQYVARAFSYLKKPWLIEYSMKQVMIIDTAENARKIFLEIVSQNFDNLSDFLLFCASIIKTLKVNISLDINFKKTRRLTAAFHGIINNWSEDVGHQTGMALSAWLDILLKGDKSAVEEQTLFDIIDDALSILLRLIELRFSFALQASTYEVLNKASNKIERRVWSNFIRQSEKINKVRSSLKEAALVLARQNRTDSAIISIINTSYYSKSQATSALKAYFIDAKELDPDIHDWWIQGGMTTKSQRKFEHHIGNPEDQQIGALLIEVENSKHAMEKLERAVVPFLEISDPPLAATVKKATNGYKDIARIARQLARMRKLTKTDIQGKIVEYNPIQQEMLGGHKLGIRTVRIVRDGIQKEFAGKIKILVKPWVENAD